MVNIISNRTPDTIAGTADPDLIVGSIGPDLISGAGGADTLNGGGGIDTIHGGQGGDMIVNGRGFLFGELGDDHIIGGDLEQTVLIDGGAGNDVLENKFLGDGYPSLTYVAFTTATGGIHLDLNKDGPQDIGGGQGVDTVLHVPNALGTPYDDVITGSYGRVYGYAGNDLLIGGGGGANLIGGQGDDTLQGGAGVDIADYSDDDPNAINADSANQPFLAGLHVVKATGGITIDLNLTTAQDVGGGFGRDTLINIKGVTGTIFADRITGDGADNVLSGLGGSDTIYGGAGNDRISGGGGIDTTSSNVLHGEDGNDTIVGGDAFDEMQGNKGDDSLRGGGGADWVVGGQDQDKLYGEAGADLVYGNLGNDLCDGGAGDDVIRGGQGDDTLLGGDGNDFLAGDRGSDTLTGGAGADRFYSFADAGVDRVTDFNRAEGDRVEIQTGDAWTVAQVGADTVVTVGGSAQLILVGVTMSSLTGDWIYSGTT